jgi:hypothetical protein
VAREAAGIVSRVIPPDTSTPTSILISMACRRPSPTSRPDTNADPDDPSTMSFCDNFMGFWNQWKHNIIIHDYTLLDKIHPGRIWTAALWIAKRGTTGEGAPGGSLWDRLQTDELQN